MKTKYKYINFQVVRDRLKMKVWGIYNNRTQAQLGGVAWYSAWRSYCFYAVDNTCVFDEGCLSDIVDFIKQLMKERKKQ